MRHAWSRFATILLAGALVAVCRTGAWADDGSAAAPGDDAAARAYLAGNGLLNRGLYEMAAAEYETFLAAHGDHEDAPVARYALGVCYFRTGHYDKAIEALTKLPSDVGFKFAAEAGTMLGNCLLALQRYDEAVDACRQVVTLHGEHDLADDAAACLVEASFMTQRYADATGEAQRFAERWPGSSLGTRVAFYDGRARMAQGDDSGAAKCFSAVLAGKPDAALTDQASFLLARCYDRDGQTDRAVAAYRAVLKRDESTYAADALLSLAVLLRAQGKSDEAGALLDRLLERHAESPLLPHARLQRAFVWFDAGEFDQAKALFRKVAESDATLADTAVYWAAKCRLRQGDFDEAAEALRLAIGAYPKSDLAPEMLYDRAVALVKAGRSSDAITALTEFMSRFPEHAMSADALYLLAAETHRAGEYDRSRDYCRAFLDKYADNASSEAVAFMWGENEFLAGRYDKAVERFRSFLADYPGGSRALAATSRMGTALHRLGRFDEAIAVLAPVAQRVLQHDAYRSALWVLGDAYFQRSEWKSAERHLAAYVQQSPTPSAADDAWLKLGLARERQGNHEQALDAFDQVIERFDKSPHRLQAIFERGQVLLAMGRYAEAKSAFEQVLSHPDNERFAAHALNHLGAIAAHGDDYAAAAGYFERVDKLAPSEGLGADALYRRGQSLMAAGKWDEADEVLGRFLKEHASHARAPEARVQRATALCRRNRCDEARAEIERVAKDQPGEGVAERLAGARYELAWCLREAGDLEGASDAYRVLLREGANAVLTRRAMLELAGLEEQAERFEEAASLLRRLVGTFEGAESDVSGELREQATYRLGVCEFRSGRYREAAGALTAFVEAFPDSDLLTSAMFFAGEASLKLGKSGAAAPLFERVVKQCGTGELCAPSLLRLGESFAAAQVWAKSERAFAEFLDRFADHEQWYQARFGLGWARENQKRYDEAMAAYREVTARHKGETAARAQFQIGECLFAKGQFEQAARALLEVDILYAYPAWSAAALFEAGRCFDELGMRVEAAKQFRTVVEKHDGTRWAAMAKERLAKPKRVTIPGKNEGTNARQAANRETE